MRTYPLPPSAPAGAAAAIIGHADLRLRESNRIESGGIAEATSLLPLPVSNRDANGKVEESGWMPYLPFSLPLGIGQKVGAESPEQGNSYGRPLPSGSADFHQMQQGPL